MTGAATPPNTTVSQPGGPPSAAYFQVLNGILQALNRLASAFGTASGDISGTFPGPITVTGIEGNGAGQTSWTPTDASGAGLVFTGVSATATRLGNLVFASATLTYPVTADGTAALIAGLPFPAANHAYAAVPSIILPNGGTITLVIAPVANTNTGKIWRPDTGAAVPNSALSGLTISFILTYSAT